VKVEIYICDRCGKEIRKPEGRKPSSILLKENGNKDTLYHLCEDCLTSFMLYMEKYEAFDKLADKIVVEGV